MSRTVEKSEIYTITFASREDKVEAIGYLLHANLPFRGIAINTITVNKYVFDFLKAHGIKFK